MSGFRGSNLTKTMASLQGLESFEPLNPLTPDPDFGNLFCVFRQAIGKLLFAIPFCRASYWEIQHRAGPQICSLLASYREIAHNAENGSYSLVYCCKYNCLLGIALPQKTFLKRFYKPKKPFEKSLRAPMEDQGTKDGTVAGSKADQKKIQPRDLFWRPKFAAILASSNRPLSVCTQHTNFATELSTHARGFF